MATDVLTSPARLGSVMKTRVYKNFIDGEWVDASTGETFENRNPADTRDVVGVFQRSGKADVSAAIAAAERAFARWRLVPAPRRAEIVFTAAEMLLERKEDAARDMTREMGKILDETHNTGLGDGVSGQKRTGPRGAAAGKTNDFAAAIGARE